MADEFGHIGGPVTTSRPIVIAPPSLYTHTHSLTPSLIHSLPYILFSVYFVASFLHPHFPILYRCLLTGSRSVIHTLFQNSIIAIGIVVHYRLLNEIIKKTIAKRSSNRVHCSKCFPFYYQTIGHLRLHPFAWGLYLTISLALALSFSFIHFYCG